MPPKTPQKRQSTSQPDAAVTVKKARTGRAESPEPSDDLKARARALLEDKGVNDGIPASLFCPITQALLQDPVMTVDGFTYERVNIENWFKRKKTSPSTNLPISDVKLTPNLNIKWSIDEFLTARARELRRSEQHSSAGTHHVCQNLGPVKSVSELAGMFSKLDGMRDLLAETLKDWGPPKIVVIGSESSGKSSVLERLMMTPLLPRDQEICTRLPIHIYLRRSQTAEAPVLEVYDTVQKKTVRQYIVTAEQGAQDVSTEMKKILTELQEEGVTGAKIIKLHIKNPNVPCLDLIDMPGLVTSGNSEALRVKLPEKTKKLMTDHIKGDDGKNSLYLAILKSTQSPNSAETMRIINEYDLSGKTFGVFTHCDEVSPGSQTRNLREWVLEPTKGQGIKLEPYGWVATTNAPEEGCINNFERLQKQAQAEVGIFKKLGFDDLLTKGLASHDALVSRLNKAFVNHLKSTWVLNTLRKLSEERRKLDFENVMLGMPAAHTPETRPAVKDAIVKAVKTGFDEGISSLVHKYANYVLQKMKKDIQDAVQRAIQDSIPLSWPPLVDSVVLSREEERCICSWVADHKEQSVKLELVYRASRDGWKATDFHSRCDDKGSTVTAIKTTCGNVFGGFADVAWNSNSGFCSDPNAFTFSMRVLLTVGSKVKLARNFADFGDASRGPLKPGDVGVILTEDVVHLRIKTIDDKTWSYPRQALAPDQDIPLKMPQLNPDKALHCSPSNGPTFGDGEGIHVADLANSNTNSYFNTNLEQLPGTESRKFKAQEIEVFRVVPSDVDRFSLVVPLRNFNQIFELKPDMEGPLMRLCDRYLQDDASFWVEGVQEMFPDDDTIFPVWSSSSKEVKNICETPPLLLVKRFGGEQGVVSKLTDTFKQQEVKTQIREAVSGFAKHFNSEVASAEWPKTITGTTDGCVVDVVKTDRVTALTNQIVQSFLRYNTELLEDVFQRVDSLVGQATLIENCANDRLEIMKRITQLERAQDGILELLCEHAEKKEDLELIALVCTVGTCVVVTKGIIRLTTNKYDISKGSVGTVISIDNDGDPRFKFDNKPPWPFPWVSKREIVGHVCVLTTENSSDSITMNSIDQEVTEQLSSEESD